MPCGILVYVWSHWSILNMRFDNRGNPHPRPFRNGIEHRPARPSARTEGMHCTSRARSFPTTGLFLLRSRSRLRRSANTFFASLPENPLPSFNRMTSTK